MRDRHHFMNDLRALALLVASALFSPVAMGASCVPDIDEDLSAVVLPYTQIAVTAGASDDIEPVCDPLMGMGVGTGGDVIFRFTPPCRTTYTFVAKADAGLFFDTVLSVVQDDACTGAIIGCNDDHGGTLGAGYASTDSRVQTILNGGTNYFIIIDGKGGEEGLCFFEMSSNGCTCGGLGSENLAENTAVSLKTNGTTIGVQSFPYENDMEAFAGFTSRGHTGTVPAGFSEQNQRWELGAPSAVKLTGDHTRGGGTKCLMTDLDGGVLNYNGRMTAIGQWVAVPALTTLENPSVSFWFSSDSTPPGRGNVVLASVQIEDSGGTIRAIHPNRNNFSQFPPLAVYGSQPMCGMNDTITNPPGWWLDHSVSEDPTNEDGWAFCTIDLTSFAGQTVRLRWNYWNLGFQSGCFGGSACPAPGMAVDDLKFGSNVVISEVRPGNGTGSDPTWIEIYNNGPTTVDLSQWTIEVHDGTSLTITPLPIAPLRTYHAVVVIEGPSPHGVEQTWTHIWNRLTTNMNNTTGGAVTLKDPNGVAVDFVKWGGNPTSTPAQLLWSGTIGNPTAVNSLGRTRLAVDTGRAEDFDVTNGRDSARPTPAYDNDSSILVEIVSVSLKKASVGSTFIDKLEAIGGTPPYTWSLVAGTWPALTPPVGMGPVPTTGVVTTGASVINSGQEGLFNLRVRVTDSIGATDEQDLVLTIGPLSPRNLDHTGNTPTSIAWTFTDDSATETAFAIRDASPLLAGTLLLNGIGASCPRDASGYGTTVGSTIPDVVGGCHMAGDATESGLAENFYAERSVHAAHALPSIVQGIVINEIDLGQNDMVELYNYNTTDTDISGWKVELNVRLSAASCTCGSSVLCDEYTFGAGTILKSGATIRVYDNGITSEDTTSVKNKGTNWNPATGSVMNVALRNAMGTVIDLVKINADYTCRQGAATFSGFVTMSGRNKLQRIVDLDSNSVSDWRTEPAIGTPGSLNPGQAGIVIFQAESALVTDMAPVANKAAAYSSVHSPVVSDIAFPATGDTFIDVSILQPSNNPTRDNTGIQVEFFLDADTTGSVTGGESPAVLAAWMAPDEGGAYLDPTQWANVYAHSHSGLNSGAQYCYRFRYRNGDGDPAGPGDITGFSPWSCAVTTANCSLGGGICGDCDGDGFNTITDSLMMAKIDAGLAAAPAYATGIFNACNVHGAIPPNAAASISVIDALSNARFIVGLRTLSCCVP